MMGKEGERGKQLDLEEGEMRGEREGGGRRGSEKGWRGGGVEGWKGGEVEGNENIHSKEPTRWMIGTTYSRKSSFQISSTSANPVAFTENLEGVPKKS